MRRPEQTRGQSLVEALTNVAIGYCVALVAQLVILPAFGVHVPFASHLGIAGCFTVVSIVRTYYVRRWFERRIGR